MTNSGAEAVSSWAVNLLVDCGEYLCTISLRANVLVWLDASKKSQDNVRLNRYVRDVVFYLSIRDD